MSPSSLNFMPTDIEDLLREASKQLQNRVGNYEGTGSGWIISNLVALDTTVWQLDPLRASTYHPLSAWIQNTKCVINVQILDEKFFKYAVLADLYNVPRDPQRVSSYTSFEVKENVPDFSTLKFPVTLRSIGKFEERNDISVNVYAVEEKERKAGKRKATSDGSAPKRRRNEFIDDECDDEESDEDGNLPDLIDDDVSDDELSMYRTLNNQMDQEEEEEEKDDNKRGIAYPVRVTKQELTLHVNLLLTERDGVWHCSTIKTLVDFYVVSIQSTLVVKPSIVIHVFMVFKQRHMKRLVMTVYYFKNTSSIVNNRNPSEYRTLKMQLQNLKIFISH